MSVKCRDFNACSKACNDCDILINKKCDKELNFDIPKKFIRVERTDHLQASWNECPVCRNHIGYHPTMTNYRCNRCNQLIAWV